MGNEVTMTDSDSPKMASSVYQFETQTLFPIRNFVSTMQVFVKTESGQNFTIEVNSSENYA